MLASVPSAGHAQIYPTRPVRLLVGFPPGGGSDVGARIIANRLSEVWGQQVIVENKPGAGGHLAIDVAAHANPDGYRSGTPDSAIVGSSVAVANRFFDVTARPRT